MDPFVSGWRTARPASLAIMLAWAASLGFTGVATAQSPPAGDDTRAGRIAAQQKAKSGELRHYEPNKAEIWVTKLEEQFLTGDRKLVKPDLALLLLGVIVWEIQAEEVLACLGGPHDKPTFGDGDHRGTLGKQRDTSMR